MVENKGLVGLSWEPSLPKSSSSSTNKSQHQSNFLWKSNTELVEGLYVPPNDPRIINKMLRKQVKDTAGKSWFNMPAPTITPELQRDLQLLKMRNVIDPKRHYKKGDTKASLKYFQVGTVIESPLDFFSGRLTKKERKSTLADELLSDRKFGKYRKRKVKEIEETNHAGGNEKWKNKGKQTYKRAKQRRH